MLCIGSVAMDGRQRDGPCKRRQHARISYKGRHEHARQPGQLLKFLPRGDNVLNPTSKVSLLSFVKARARDILRAGTAVLLAGMLPLCLIPALSLT